MHDNLAASDRLRVELRPDLIVIRSQWVNIVGSIIVGCAFIAGVIVISVANGLLLSHDWFPWTVTSILVLAGLFIMVPRRMTVSFECKNRKMSRAYSAAFGLITRRREISFDDIACVAVQNYESDGEALSRPIIRQRNQGVISLAMSAGSRDEAFRAVQAISSATGIILEA
ncbi:MAG: hypothetical protein WBF58_23790 [Xanthobacteraceae bacterium]